uniref:Sec-independent protein translocase protein TatC n=1 Tax=Eiseniibacteriota bacterium TaxID=2212470 RepID=A0A832I016_UNCEI
MTIDPRREPDFADHPEAVARRMAARARGLGDDPDAAPGAGEMTFFEHLEELRLVLLHSVAATAAGAVGGWLLAPWVLEDIVRRTVRQAIVLSPLEAFNERLKLALVLGLLLALPVVLWRLWSFIVPGLFRRERRLVLPMVGASAVLFAAGALAAYLYVVPLVVDVLGQFMTPSVRAEIRLGALLGFVYNMALACGLVCQMPLVTMTLTALGLVTPGALLRQWRYAVVGAFLVTALITPGDVVTAQVVMGVPMTLLYFLSVGLSWLVAKRRREDADPGG